VFLALSARSSTCSAAVRQQQLQRAARCVIAGAASIVHRERSAITETRQIGRGAEALTAWHLLRFQTTVEWAPWKKREDA
jgi:hypothetical protein